MVRTPYWRKERISVLETEVDDMTGQLLGHLLHQGLGQGALDFFYTPVLMKKNRPGVQLTLLCRGRDTDRFLDFLFRQTTTLGVRVRRSERAALDRDQVRRIGPHGPFRVKRGLGPAAEVINEAPEFEDLRDLAAGRDLPLKRVWQESLQGARGEADEVQVAAEAEERPRSGNQDQPQEARPAQRRRSPAESTPKEGRLQPSEGKGRAAARGVPLMTTPRRSEGGRGKRG